MAKTFTTRGLKATVPSQPVASWIRQTFPKGSSTTFVAGAPMKASSGLVVEWVDPSDADIVGFSTAAAKDGETTVQGMWAMPEVILEANFLGGSAADTTLAASDLWLSRDLSKDANLLGTGEAGWYIEDASADVAVDVVEFDTQDVHPTIHDYKPEAGDTNARVRAHVRPGVSAWY